MPRGNTATIDIVSFRVQWDSHVPIRALCENFNITRDQVTRLKFVWQLAPRHDRRLRFKPERQRDPTPREIEQACKEIQAKWDEHTRYERAVTKPTQFQLRQIETPEDLRHMEGGE
jgi:hypothetical protein